MSIAILTLAGLLSGDALAQAAEPPPAIPAEPPPAIPAAAPPPPPPTVGAPPMPPRSDKTYQQGYADGRSLAESEPVLAWAGAGAGGACLFSGLGCLGVTATAGLIEPRPASAYLSGMASPGENDYWAGYHEGYSKRLRSRRATAAFLGGTAATAVVGGVAILAIAAVSSPIYINAY